MIALVTRRKHPPNGFKFFCPKCGLSVKKPLAPFNDVVSEIARHRRNNPDHGLTIMRSEISDELDIETCRRLGTGKWCVDVTEQMKQAHEQAKNKANCPGCGRRKKAK